MLFLGDTRTPLCRNRIATDQPRWSWAEALGAAEPGARYRISDLVFSLVRDRCRELGLEEGDEIRCLENRRWWLELERPDGSSVLLESDYAWFVQVEPMGRSETVSGGANWTS
jgi:hypothetical protein